jgi:mono/diheme cytochrome c family protein
MTKIAITLVMVLFALPALAFADGKTDFDANCARCHGGDARTITKRSNILKIDPTKLALRASEMNEAEMIAIIEKGKNLMPGFENELTKDQIRAVVEYIRAQKK